MNHMCVGCGDYFAHVSALRRHCSAGCLLDNPVSGDAILQSPRVVCDVPIVEKVKSQRVLLRDDRGRFVA